MEYPRIMPPATTADPAELLAADAPFADLATAPVVVAPEQDGPGAWAGGPSALLVGDTVYLAYRLRRPVGQGRGYANVVARSTDGVRFRTVATVGKDPFGAESLERPALVVTAGRPLARSTSAAPRRAPSTGGSTCSRRPPRRGWPTAPPRTVLPGSDRLGGQGPGACGTTAAAGTSGPPCTRWTTRTHDRPDDHRVRHQRRRRRLDLARHRAGRPRPASWDARGVRVAPVRLDGAATGRLYDGRATAERELGGAHRPGHRRRRPGRLSRDRRPDRPARSPYGLRRAALLSARSRCRTAAPGSTRGHPGRRRPRPAHGSGACMPLPDFLVIGAPKAGTTALHVALARHPRLFMSRVKEPKFFLTDGPPPAGRRPRRRADLPASTSGAGRDYEALFDAAPPARCAASPPRSTCTTAPRSAGSRGGPRGPADRGAPRPGRPGALQLDPPVVGGPRAGGRLPARLRRGGAAGRRRAGRRSGATSGSAGTASSSTHLFTLFPREQVLRAALPRPASTSPADTLDRICDFLGVEPGVLTEIPGRTSPPTSPTAPGTG